LWQPRRRFPGRSFPDHCRSVTVIVWVLVPSATRAHDAIDRITAVLCGAFAEFGQRRACRVAFGVPDAKMAE
jgi:hypothetical protein